MIPRLRHPDVRLYRAIRSVHLERAHAARPTSIVYSETRYDFDESAMTGLDLHRLSTPRAALAIGRARIDHLEVTEPLARAALWRAVVVVAVLRASDLVRRRRTVVGTYAIENLDQYDVTGRRFVSRVRRRIERAAARRLLYDLDKVVFGTGGAASVYDDALGRRDDAVVVPALPASCECLATAPGEIQDDGDLVFLGAFTDRKGFPDLLRAWPVVRAAAPEARLTLLGKGPLEAAARDLASSDPTVSLEVDPPRARIHAVLRSSRVLVLPSRRMPGYWREQVGLPLVEALAHGMSVVTTDETGLAGWLAAHGHTVISEDVTPDALAGAVLQARAARRRRDDVLADLPGEDGRLHAERVLRETVDSKQAGQGLPTRRSRAAPG